MSLFKNEVEKLKEQMNKLKENVLQFKDKIENMHLNEHSSEFGEIYELYTALQSCYESFNTHQAAPNKFVIPDNLLTAEFSCDDPLLTLYEGLEHLKKLHGFLTEFKSDLDTLPDVMPREPRQIIKTFQRKKTQTLRIPRKMLRVESYIESVPNDIEIINHPKPLTIAESRRSLDRELVGNDYVPFNLAIPDERTTDEASLLNRPPTSKQIVNASVSGSPEEVRHNIQLHPEEISSLCNVHNTVVESEIRSQSNILQPQSTLEIPTNEQTDIDENAMEILQELMQQNSLRKNAITRLSNTSSDNTKTKQTLSCAPKPLKKTKFRQIRDPLVVLPQDIKKYRIPPHYFDVIFNVHVQGVIDTILEKRSTIKQTNDEHQTQVEEGQLTRSHNEVQPIRTDTTHLEKSKDIPLYPVIQPDQQSEIHISTLDYIPEHASVLPSQKSPLPIIRLIHDPDEDKERLPKPDREKLPDASYSLFEDLLQQNNQAKQATPKKGKASVVTTIKKSLRQMSEDDLLQHMDCDQYVSLCILREIQRKDSSSNKIDIKSIQIHFGNDRVGFCKLIRSSIDLIKCHDLICILKNKNNEICGIEIFES